MIEEGLRFDDVEFRFSKTGVPVLRAIDLAIGPGELVVIVGASGSGKSTLLRLVAGFASPSRGTLSFAGHALDELAPRDRDVGMVFQDYALYPHLSVSENLTFPLRARGMRRSDAFARAEAIAARLHLTEVLPRYPRELSGGQRQRVALGRLLVRSPRIALFDEPLSNLDVALRRELRAEIRALHDVNRWTTLYVTHDPLEAAALADRIAVLCRGTIVQHGTYDELRSRPLHREVVSLLSPSLNLASRAIVPAAWHCGGAQEIAIDADALSVVAPDHADLTAVWLGPLDNAGGSRYAVVRTSAGTQWTVRAPAGPPPIGSKVGLELDRGGRVLAFDAEGRLLA